MSCWSSTSATRIVIALPPHVRGVSGSLARTTYPPPRFGPAVSVPPKIVARSRMPSMPPPVPSPDAAPRPSSLIGDLTASSSHRSWTNAVTLGPACLRTFVRPSWAMRYTASPAPMGSGRGVPVVT